MKKLFIIFALTFGWLMNVSAQKEKLYNLFDKYQETDGVTSIKIAKPMFGMLSKLDLKDAELDNIKPMLDKIQGLRILVIEKPDIDSINKQVSKSMMNFTNLQKEISSSLKSLNYEELITVNSKDAKMKFLAAAANNGILDNLLLSVNADGNTVLMMLDGKISMDDVNKLANEAQTSAMNFTSNRSSSSSSSSITEEVRKVGNFHGIKVSSGIKVSFTQGNSQNVRVETDADKLEYVKTELENGILNIYVKNPNNRGVSFKKLHVDITAPRLNSIAATSGANFTALNTINEDSFDVTSTSGANISADLIAKGNINASTTSGSNMKLNIKAKNLQMTSTSGSDATVVGSADDTSFQVSSAASVNAQDLVSRSSTVAASSAASVKVNVSERLTATASSGATIRYRNLLKSAPTSSTSSGGTVKSF